MNGARRGYARACELPRLALCLALVAAPAAARAQTPRPTIGVAFGGGSARGIAHIGVIQWFEENHIPIDTAAGTSMGGLIGGAFATGMSAAELRAFVKGIDWDTMFGSSTFPFKNVRRKEDARSYPSRLEFGLKGGVTPPTSLNDGQQVDFLLARLAAPYYAIQTFDDLPTPFRVVAVDLRAREKVVIDRGSLSTALRATMSLPAIFPPVVRDDRVLVDGGVLDNIPADVVRAAGASTVIAVSVGYAPNSDVSSSMFGLIGETTDVMMHNATLTSLKSADMTLAVDVEGFGSLDWRRTDELIERGYQSAEKRRDELLKYRISDDQWQQWLAARAGRRKAALPQPAFLVTEGIVASDAAIARRVLELHLNVPIDFPALERDLASLTGLDRYQSISWTLVEQGGQTGLLVRAREKPYAPPFLMLGLNIANTTSEDFRVALTGRYLAFDVLGSGSELRIDAALGGDPSLGASLYQPIPGSRLFARGSAVARRQAFGIVQDHAVIAEYRERRLGAAADLGVNLSKDAEVAGGFAFTHRDDEVRTGDPGLPSLSGGEVTGRIRWTFDQQDSPIVPSHGTRAVATFTQTFTAPATPQISRTNNNLTQFELGVSSVVSVNRGNRVFGVLTGGTSFDDHPLPTEQFTLGYPFVLDAFDVGERRGDHFAVLTLGALHQLSRLPDFIGGPVFIGAWFETGSAFSTHENAEINAHLGAGIIMDTLVGPVLVGLSSGLDGGWRTFVGVGRVFR